MYAADIKATVRTPANSVSLTSSYHLLSICKNLGGSDKARRRIIFNKNTIKFFKFTTTTAHFKSMSSYGMGFTLTSYLVTCAFCYGIFHFVMWHLRRRRLYELASRFEGPPVLPILGNAHMLVGSTEYVLKQMIEVMKLYPSPYRVWIGPLLVLCFSDPEHIKTICLSPKTMGKNFEMQKYGKALFGEGLLTAPVSKWKVHRKLIQPTFNAKILESFVEIFATQSIILAGKMEPNLNGPEFETFEFVSLCTLDMICETSMGVKVDAQTNGFSQYLEAVEEEIATFIKRISYFWLGLDFIFRRTKLGKKQLKNIKYLDDFVGNITRIKKEEYFERSIRQETDSNFENSWDSTPQRRTFLDRLMELGESHKFSDKVLRDEVLTMILAGNDSAAHAISYVMLMLAWHPDLQDKVYQELSAIFGNTDIAERPVTPKDLTQMKYLERVIKETMRLFPPAPFIVRQVSEELNIGEHTLPAGCAAFINIMNLHRNEKYWPEPLRFDPDRFLPEANARRHPYAYMAFSGGPRNCIGHHYAMLSMKTMIATILRRFVLKKDTIVPINDIRLKWEILMIPVDPIKIRIERRTRN